MTVLQEIVETIDLAGAGFRYGRIRERFMRAVSGLGAIGLSLSCPSFGRGMIVSMRSRAAAWTLAGLAALAVVVLVVASGGGGDEAGDGSPPDGPVAAETSVTEAPPPHSEPTTVPLPPSTTTTITPPSTTTTMPTTTTAPATTTTTTTTAPPGSSPPDYTPIPKPGAGPENVAPGGALTKHLAADIATAFGLDTAEVEAAIAAVALPPEAGGYAEGWLAPGSYQPADDAGAADIVQAMVDRRVAQLEERQFPRDQWHRVLTAASVIEKETYNQNEKPRVARVLTNRLAGGGPLQMDSIILYPVPEDRIFTTGEERASDQPYNSYKHNGLPPTPICSPDEASLDAFLAPPPGNWWFYVTIDLHSGETRFAVSYQEHRANVELLRAWLRDHPTR
ncbi:MAG: endolytic transglycosylase MltG [Acidimicrobiia bacterium]|nr:endolytic transglycosylase MltG [Acidimicrobiia bacterium]